MLAAYHSRKFRRSGFTLIELLVSLTVSSIILVALFQALSQATISWGTQTKSFSGQRELRSVMRLLTDDLAAVVARRALPLQTSPGTQFILEQATDGFGSSRLAFLRASPELGEVGGEETGDMELVMYAVVLTPSGGASSTASVSTSQKLVRRTLDAPTTMARLHNHITADAPLVTVEDWSYLAGQNPGVEVVADNVIRFSVLPKEEREGDVGRRLDDVVPWNTENANDVIPPWLAISITVVNKASAQQLSSIQDWQGRGNFAEFITNNTPDDPSDDREAMTLNLQVRLQVSP